jgi:hypothetical protein
VSALDVLPPDQRAALQLLLQQGLSYEDLAGMLGMEPGALRHRAVAGLETIGPDAGRRLAPERRAEIADYLLRQQSDEEAAATREHLASSAGARAWARALAAELRPLAKAGVPDIPAEAPGARGAVPPVPPADAEGAAEREPAPFEQAAGTAASPPSARAGSRPWASSPRAGVTDTSARSGPDAASAPPEPAAAPAAEEGRREDRGKREVSRLGGALLIAGIGILAVVLLVAVVLLGRGFLGGDDDAANDGDGAAQTQPGQPQVVGQINLTSSPEDADYVGLVQIVNQNGERALAIVGQDLPPSSERAAYAVWLYNSPSQARRLGFPPPVGEDGRLSGLATLPENAGDFREVVISRDSDAEQDRPGRIVLRGELELPAEGDAQPGAPPEGGDEGGDEGGG